MGGRLRHDVRKDVRSRRQISSRWFSPAWPTGPARRSSAAAQLSSRHRLLLARATRQEVLGLYRRIFRLARKWQAASGQMEDTIKEKQYILNEARTLFQKNKNVSVQPVSGSASSEDPMSQVTQASQQVLECPSCAKHWTRHGGYKMSETKTGSLKDVSELDGKQCKIAIGLTDTDQIKQCIDECTARIEIGLHYQIPYPRPIHLPPMGLTPLRGRGLRSQEKLRKLSKPVYLKSHDEIS
ncbi:LYR motif-containing protein 1 isoform X4 [Lutra lutra]|uniref:LYR motif-containing protein 1 isoform X4 n=1 Tax=Lutra lutra TaxID=9657 RepID=UPI001FD21C3B|nr:LYR motif-containing protein 1 isoform X4 [Lutra lutra]